MWLKNDSDLTAQISSEFWSDPAGYIDKHAVIVKKSGYHRNVFSFNIDESDKRILIKHFVFSTFKEKLKWKFGKSPAKKEWEILNHLSDNGVATPKPLAFGSRKNETTYEAWLIIEFVDGAVTFDQVRPPKSIKQTLAATRELAKTIAGLHFASVRHGDLHSGNLLYIPPSTKNSLPYEGGVVACPANAGEDRGGSNTNSSNSSNPSNLSNSSNSSNLSNSSNPSNPSNPSKSSNLSNLSNLSNKNKT